MPTDPNLIFSQPPSASADLLFGATDSPVGDYSVSLAVTLPPLTFTAAVAPISRVTLAATLPPLSFAAALAPTRPISLAATLPPLTFSASVQYDARVERPTVAAHASPWQAADHNTAGIDVQHQDSQRQPTAVRTPWSLGDSISASRAEKHQALIPLAPEIRPAYQNAVPRRQPLRAAHANMPHFDAARRAAWQNGTPCRRVSDDHWQERDRDRRPRRQSRWSSATPTIVERRGDYGQGTPSAKKFAAAYQEAQRPPPGRYTAPVIPLPPLYTPDANLLFSLAVALDGNLLFSSDAAPPGALVIVPIKRAYIVINQAQLFRVDNDVATVEIPVFNLSLSLDTDSWAWNFSAAIPATALADLEPSAAGDPVELLASINGQSYRLLAESISRERSFAQSTLRVAGRGKTATLDAPYAPIRAFASATPRTAQQLMADALTINNVSLGWAVDFGLTDWLVPADVWSHQGSYITALSAIAAAAGGYIQPHPTLQQIAVLPRYPTGAWTWDSLTPDIELPAAVTTREGIEWQELPRYNAVYVAGGNGGILGHVKRQGSAGDLIAPMVTDPLITHADAARQRGIAILSATGRQANISLRLPVLDATGIITPGKFVRYVDGNIERTGIVRSTTVDVGLPEIFQTIGVETHVA